MTYYARLAKDGLRVLCGGPDRTCRGSFAQVRDISQAAWFWHRWVWKGMAPAENPSLLVQAFDAQERAALHELMKSKETIRLIHFKSGAWSPGPGGVWRFSERAALRARQGFATYFRRRSSMEQRTGSSSEERLAELPLRAECRECGIVQVLDLEHLSAPSHAMLT